MFYDAASIKLPFFDRDRVRAGEPSQTNSAIIAADA